MLCILLLMQHYFPFTFITTDVKSQKLFSRALAVLTFLVNFGVIGNFWYYLLVVCFRLIDCLFLSKVFLVFISFPIVLDPKDFCCFSFLFCLCLDSEPLQPIPGVLSPATVFSLKFFFWFILTWRGFMRVGKVSITLASALGLQISFQSVFFLFLHTFALLLSIKWKFHLGLFCSLS